MAKGRAGETVLEVDLEVDGVNELSALARMHGAPQALAARARIGLSAAECLDNSVDRDGF